MNKSIGIFLFVFLASSYSIVAIGQQNKFSILANLGVSTPILDNGIGATLGMNPSFRLNKYFSIEGQLSYIYTKTYASFIAGKQGQNNAVNFLAGARLYGNKPGKSIRPYLNLLVGLNYAKDELNGKVFESVLNPGLSTGIFVEFKKIVVGVTFDTPQNLNLKAGYIF
jgi:hypothetical protein